MTRGTYERVIEEKGTSFILGELGCSTTRQVARQARAEGRTGG